MDKVDLHVHSTASDGIYSPARLVECASINGYSVFALSDHDTFDGITEALAKAEETGLGYIPAIELSVNLEKGGNAHLLGYFPGASPEQLMEPENTLFKIIIRIQQARKNRNTEILQKLSALGLHLTKNEISAQTGGDVTGRPHIAAAMIKKNYVKSNNEAFERFLARGKPAYVERERLMMVEAIGHIRDNDGIPVIAHPGFLPSDILEEFENVMKSFTSAGLRGIEAFYPKHSKDQTEKFINVAKRLGLTVTGGSDFHGFDDEPATHFGNNKTFTVTRNQISDFLEICGL